MEKFDIFDHIRIRMIDDLSTPVLMARKPSAVHFLGSTSFSWFNTQLLL